MFLGFLLNPENMTIRLTSEKAEDLANLCKKLAGRVEITIRELLAQVVGKMVASEPGIDYAPLYYKQLEIEKDQQLKINHGNYEAKMNLTNNAKVLLNWWAENIVNLF